MSLPRVQLQLLAPGPESVADQTMISSVLKIENEKYVIQSMQLGTCPMATPNNLRSLTIDSNKPFPFVFHNIVGTTHIWYGTYIGAWVAIFFLHSAYTSNLISQISRSRYLKHTRILNLAGCPTKSHGPNAMRLPTASKQDCFQRT
jgi:hypothetical protein